ncbi:MAG: MnmC family methyltransferase [Fusobacterium sp.]|nr:MnmC family methyltransferase [Fusobacterium sp.]
MKDFYPYITNDGSVGLYSPEFDDIYHSTFGAYAESCEKFVLPADIKYYITNFNKINILDICYGIGYNTKSFLNKFYSTDTIYSDNISIYINAIDNDEELVFLSPFFTANAKKMPKRQNLPTEKVKHLSSGKIERQFGYDNFINYILVERLAAQFPEFLSDEDLQKYLKNRENRPYLENKAVEFYNYRRKAGLTRLFKGFLHNIYYHHISSSYKKALKARRIADIAIDYNIDDARRVILNDDKKYHLVFLDAFTPTKCPCLWTLDFFKLLSEHLDDNGRILTYSNSALVRSALLSAGFCVGKIYNERTKTFTGTIAVKNKEFIKHDLSEYDLSLVKTRAGIFYRDENLNGLNEAIIERHKKEVEESPLISSSKFIKQYRKEHNNV